MRIENIRNFLHFMTKKYSFGTLDVLKSQLGKGGSINMSKTMSRTMSIEHEISEYINNLPIKMVRCKGYRSEDVYQVISHICTLYNQLLSQVNEENEKLRQQLDSGDMEYEVYSEVQPLEESPVVYSNKEIQKLKRAELLEILLEQSKENDFLKGQLEEKDNIIVHYKKKLSERKIELEKAGTIAEASFQLNGVLEAAEKASQQYLDNLQDLYNRENALCTTKEEEFENKCAAIMHATQERCDFMKEEMEKRCEEMLKATETKCQEREKVSEEMCAILDKRAKDAVDNRWNELSKRLEAFYASHDGLREMMAAEKI